MKGLSKDLLVFITLFIGAILIVILIIGQSAIDIQLHDTYFVLSAAEILILIIGPLTFLVFFSLGLTRKFKTKWTNIGIVLGLIMISFIIYEIALLQISYRDQIQNNPELMALPLQDIDRERFVNLMDGKIKFTWGLFGICIVGIGIIGFRTYKFSNERR